MPHPNARALIFDLDGTIADTIGAICDGINETMRAYDYPEKTYEDIRIAIGNGARLLVKRCMPADAAQDEQQVSRVLNTYDTAYAHTYLHTDRCYDGIPAAITALCARGYRIAVLSNKQDAFVKGLIAQLLPGGECEIVLGQTVLPTKPDPTVPRLIAEQLGVSPTECVMIGDSEVDIATAKNAGMHSIGCAWGYRGREALSRAGADAVIDTPLELIEIL